MLLNRGFLCKKKYILRKKKRVRHVWFNCIKAVLWPCEIQGAQHMICMKKWRFSSHLRAKVRRQGPLNAAIVQPCNIQHLKGKWRQDWDIKNEFKITCRMFFTSFQECKPTGASGEQCTSGDSYTSGWNTISNGSHLRGVLLRFQNW